MPRIQEADYWAHRYRLGETGWDLGGPTPSLQRLLREGTFPVPPPSRVLVPGCGYGHDVLLLARAGYEVIALDFAAEPLCALQVKAQQEGVQQNIHALQKDLFETDAEAAEQPVEAVWEYTCFCAIDPSQRQAYFERMRSWLRPTGYLVGLFFPLSMPLPIEGPPFLVEEEEVRSLAEQAGFKLVYREVPTDSHPARRGREVLYLFTVEG